MVNFNAVDGSMATVILQKVLPPPKRLPIQNRYSAPPAFSLVELLVVVAVVSMLMAITTPSMLSSYRSSLLTSAGNSMADVSSSAHEIAINKGSIIAMVLTEKTDANTSQAVGIFQYDPLLKNWEQISAWLVLNAAIQVADHSQDISSMTKIAPVSLSRAGKVIQPYSSLIFCPDGRMVNNQSNSALRTLSVRWTTDHPHVSRDQLTNFYDLDFNANSSSFVIRRK